MVDPHHGATLRSSWSIDHSEDLGKLDFGTTLNYDAVSTYSGLICEASVGFTRLADSAVAFL